MLSSKFLKDIMTEAYPIIQRQLEDAKVIASFRELVTANGGDWSALKALMKAHVEDSLDDAADGKRVRKILDKADSSNAYAEMLGLANMNEKNFISDEDEEEELDPLAALRNDPSLAIVHASEIKPKSKDQPRPSAGTDLAAANPPANSGQVEPTPKSNEPVWQSGKAEEVTRHRYSEAFGDLGQDMVVIADDVATGRAAPIVMLGDEVLDGWARLRVAIGAIGLDGQSTEYQMVQYSGADPLLDCIRWNVAGRMLGDRDKQVIINRLSIHHPQRKAEIIRAVTEWVD